MKILITGQAGFIGFHAAIGFKNDGWEVHGIDNFNDYYDVKLKRDRAAILQDLGISTIDNTIENFDKIDFPEYDLILHLAAYTNPRHALKTQQPYIDTNITATQRIIDVAQDKGTPVVYASSSCVMLGQPLPWNETDRPQHQNNPYGWSKHVNECQFKHSTVIRSAGLRFFTVYGPYGRPDMALFSFTRSIVKDEGIVLYNYGDMKRDFTYVDDIIQGIKIVANKLMKDEENYHEIYNIGYGDQVELIDFVDHIEKNLGRKTERKLEPMHPADAKETWSDTTKLQALGYKPTTPVQIGVAKFVEWYKQYYNIN